MYRKFRKSDAFVAKSWKTPNLRSLHVLDESSVESSFGEIMFRKLEEAKRTRRR